MKKMRKISLVRDQPKEGLWKDLSKSTITQCNYKLEFEGQ